MNVKCIIVDDEPLAIKLISSHTASIEGMEIVAKCKNAFQAMEILRTQQIDLMFLDINMPQINGLQLLQSLTHPPAVIITTAFREYAVEGFEFNVVDYLVKPISLERFMKAINKFFDIYNRSYAHHSNHVVEPASMHINVYDNKKTFRINIDEIQYIEGFGEYVKIYTPAKTYLSRETMKHYERELQKHQFLRVHKSYIVSVKEVNGFTANDVLVGKKELPIGRRYKENVLRILK